MFLRYFGVKNAFGLKMGFQGIFLFWRSSEIEKEGLGRIWAFKGKLMSWWDYWEEKQRLGFRWGFWGNWFAGGIVGSKRGSWVESGDFMEKWCPEKIFEKRGLGWQSGSQGKLMFCRDLGLENMAFKKNWCSEYVLNRTKELTGWKMKLKGKIGILIRF